MPPEGPWLETYTIVHLHTAYEIKKIIYHIHVLLCKNTFWYVLLVKFLLLSTGKELIHQLQVQIKFFSALNVGYQIWMPP